MSGPPRHAATVTLLVLVVALFATVPATVAAEPRAGGTVVVEEGETTGDLQAFGGDVVVRGTVDGDLQTASGNVRVIGEVTGSVKAAGGNVVVAGTVGGNVQAGGGHVEITETGTVEGSLEAGAGTITIDGTVRGDARVGAAEIRVGATATIGGDLEYDGKLTRSPDARIGGEVIENTDLSIGAPVPFVPGFVFSVYFLLVNLLVGALVLLVFPGFSRGLADRTVDRPGLTGLAGFGTLVGGPILFALLAITIVGLPLVFAALGVYLLGLWVGLVLGRYLLGAVLLSFVDVENRWAALLLGTLVVVGARRLPVVGGILDLGVLLWGLGALALGLVAAYRGARGRTGEASEEGEPAVAPS